MCVRGIRYKKRLLHINLLVAALCNAVLLPGANKEKDVARMTLLSFSKAGCAHFSGAQGRRAGDGA